jgi:hypothetical protein
VWPTVLEFASKWSDNEIKSGTITAVSAPHDLDDVHQRHPYSQERNGSDCLRTNGLRRRRPGAEASAIYNSSLSYYDRFVQWHKDRYVCQAIRERPGVAL